MEFVAVDIETTGFSEKYDSIIEIGAVHIKDFKVVGEFYELVHTTKIIPPEVVSLTGINNSMLRDAKTCEVVMQEFLAFIGKKPFVAHNATFDYRFIKRKMETKLGYNFTNARVCTMQESRKKWTGLKNHKLNTLCKYLDIPNLEHHNALNDARVCADILLCILDKEPVATRMKSPMVRRFQKIKNFLINEGNKFFE